MKLKLENKNITKKKRQKNKKTSYNTVDRDRVLSPNVDVSTRKSRISQKNIFRKCKPLNETYVFPESYNKTQLKLIARDPSWIYAYWDISDSSIEKIKQQIGDKINNASFVLRMYDTTLREFDGKNANHSFDIDVGKNQKSWYINLWADNVSYSADLGFKTQDNQFIPIARSNNISTQRSHSSPRQDMIWMKVEESRASDTYTFIKERNKKRNGKKLVNELWSSKRKFMLTEDDIRAYYASLFPLWRRLKTRFPLNKIKNNKIPQKKDYKVEKSYIKELSGYEYWKKRILLGASAEMIEKSGASEVVKEILKGGASEREERKRQFFFEIGTELIVYGRTEPDAEVWLGDKNIKLRPDGTFSLRFALPDGKIPLDFVAISNDRIDRRYISTSVERSKTKYS